MSPSFRAAVPGVLLIAQVFFLQFLVRAGLSPLAPALEADLGVDHAKAGAIFLAQAAGYAATLPLAGFVSARLEHRTVIGLSGVLMGLLVCSLEFVSSLWGVGVVFFLFGMGGGLYLPSGMAAITGAVESKDYGKVTSIHEIAPNLALFLAPALAAWALGHASWRTILAFVGLAQIVSGVVVLVRCPLGASKSPKLDRALFADAVRDPSFWPFVALFCLGIGASFGPYGMLPLYMTSDMGFTQAKAGELLALSRILPPFSAALSGRLSDRLGAAKTLKLYFVVAGAAVFGLGAARGGWFTVFVILHGVATAAFFPPAFAALSRAYPTRTRPLALGVLVSAGILVGNGFIPQWLGFMGDRGLFGTAFCILGALVWGGLALKFPRL